MSFLRSSLCVLVDLVPLRAAGLLLAVAGLANPLSAASRDVSQSSRENLRTALAAPVPLPAAAEFSYRPFREPAMALPDFEASAAEAEQRAVALAADLKTIVPVEKLPGVGSPEFASLRRDALAIVQRHFRENRDALEPDAIGEFASSVPWTPDFSPAPRSLSAADRKRARNSSYAVAYAITHLNRPRFVVAYAAAVMALDPDTDLGAGNAASAILAGAERRYAVSKDAAALASSRADAVIVYRYALACSQAGTHWTVRSLGLLINLGNLYVDLKSPERARPVLLAAKAFAPDSFDAALALASCYMMQGRPELAKAALEDKAVRRSALYATAAKGSRIMDEIRAAGDVSPDSSDEEIDAALESIDKKETLTAADFVQQIDPEVRRNLQRFVDDLPVQGSYRAPRINDLTQFSTVQSISQPPGFRALGDFSERLGGYSLRLMRYMMQGQQDVLGRLGLNVKLDVDLNDVMAHPERYKDRKINATVSGVEQLRARVPELKRQAAQARRDIESGNRAALARISPLVLSAHPSLAIYSLKPFEFANPMDVMMQQYNASVLGRKMQVYNAGFFAVNARTRAALAEIAARYAKKHEEIREVEALATAEFQKQRAAAARSGVNVNSPEWRLREHNLHRTYAPQYNAQADFAWKEATQVAAKAYSDKIKPRAERFYYDVFRHIALISDPEVREKKNREFEQALLFGVYQGLVHVLGAFGSAGYVQEWDCHCDVGSLLAEAENEEKELDRIREERDARVKVARLLFESGEIPEASPLFKKLDEYGTDLDIPFIPLLSGRISAARSTLALEAKLPTTLSPHGTYSFTESAFTGATTHRGSLEVSVSAEEGELKTSATLNVSGSMSRDGAGTVTDYSVTAASQVKLELGTVNGYIGGEVAYTPDGGMTSDVTGGLTAVLEGEYGRSVQVSIEGSARRGSTFSASAEQNLNPYSGEVNQFIKDVSEDATGDDFPFSASLSKELWNGKFSL